MDYHYDLELDSSGRIVGGEWYQNRHPDFVWMPLSNSVAANGPDLSVKSAYDVERIAPYSSQEGAPLKFVLDAILDNFRAL